jgi:hypothetical protein
VRFVVSEKRNDVAATTGVEKLSYSSATPIITHRASDVIQTHTNGSAYIFDRIRLPKFSSGLREAELREDEFRNQASKLRLQECPSRSWFDTRMCNCYNNRYGEEGHCALTIR